MFDLKSLSPTNLLYAKGIVTEDAESRASETSGKHHCYTITACLANLEQKASSVCIHNNLTGDFSVSVLLPGQWRASARSTCTSCPLPPSTVPTRAAQTHHWEHLHRNRRTDVHLYEIEAGQQGDAVLGLLPAFQSLLGTRHHERPLVSPVAGRQGAVPDSRRNFAETAADPPLPLDPP